MTLAYVAVAALALGLVVFSLRRMGYKEVSLRGVLRRRSLGALLVLLGLYFFPLAALEAYDATRRWFGLSEVYNGFLWYTLTTLAIVLGVVLAVGPRRSAV